VSISKIVKVNNKDGIHARPSAMIVECASKFPCNIFFYKNSKKGDAKNILDLMCMAMTYGQDVKIECEGEQELEALDALSQLFSKEFNFEK